MCVCIDNIRASYSEVRQRTTRVARKSFIGPVAHVDESQPNIDDFLDAINLITKEIYQLIQSTNDLITAVRNNFCDITTDEAVELLHLSAPISEKMKLLYGKLMESPLYSGIATVVGLYSDSISDFEELCHDLKTFRVNLENKPDFKASLDHLAQSFE